MAKTNRSSMSIEEMVKTYFDTKAKFDSLTKRFEAIKKDFYDRMNEEFKGHEIKHVYEFFAESYEVSKVVNSKVSFDIGKIERGLDREILKQVIIKTYQITDFSKFTEYLKSIGADFSEIKKYIAVTKDVDTSAIDRLSELGKVDAGTIEKAATVTQGKPYYKVKRL